jgi:hypothetical protein
VAAGNAEVALSWTAPGDGGSPITSYTVTPMVAGVAESPRVFPSAALSEVVGGLSNGTTYTLTVAAGNAVGAGPPSAPSAPVTPVSASLSIVNGGGKGGRAQEGDQIIVTFSPAPAPGAFCSAWSAASHPDLSGPDVVVQGTAPGSGDDTLTVTDGGDCSGGFHFGTIDLGQSGYFNSGASFGGVGNGCRGSHTANCSTIDWNGVNTLTITLGKESSVQPLQPAASVAVYTPDPALGLTGTISSAREVNF